MESVWIVLGLVSLMYAGGFGFLYRHFSTIYEAQMSITEKLIKVVMKEGNDEEE